MQTFDRVTTYPHGKIAFKVCESEMLKVCKAKEKIRICKAKMKLEMLSKECKSEMYMKEKEKCEMFLKYAKGKCESEMRKYVKVKKAKQL